MIRWFLCLELEFYSTMKRLPSIHHKKAASVYVYQRGRHYSSTWNITLMVCIQYVCTHWTYIHTKQRLKAMGCGVYCKGLYTVQGTAGMHLQFPLSLHVWISRKKLPDILASLLLQNTSCNTKSTNELQQENRILCHNTGLSKGNPRMGH